LPGLADKATRARSVEQRERLDRELAARLHHCTLAPVRECSGATVQRGSRP
jgi:hypothetical protein